METNWEKSKITTVSFSPPALLSTLAVGKKLLCGFVLPCRPEHNMENPISAPKPI